MRLHGKNMVTLGKAGDGTAFGPANHHNIIRKDNHLILMEHIERQIRLVGMHKGFGGVEACSLNPR